MNRYVKYNLNIISNENYEMHLDIAIKNFEIKYLLTLIPLINAQTSKSHQTLND